MTKELIIKKKDLQLLVKLLSSNHLHYLEVLGGSKLSLTREEGFDSDLNAIIKKRAADPASLNELLSDFLGKKGMLLANWLRRVRNLVAGDQLKITELSLDKSSIRSFTLPSEGLINLEINLNDLKIEDLVALLEKIDKRPIHRLRLIGTRGIEERDLFLFLERIYLAEHFDLRYENASQDKADQLMYRNHFFMFLNQQPSISIWQDALKKWMNLNAWRFNATLDSLRYFKGYFHSECYKSYLKAIYDLDESEMGDSASTQEKIARYSDQVDSWARNLEVLAGINACVGGMGDFFFEKMLEQLDVAFQNNPNPYEHLDLPLLLVPSKINILLNYVERVKLTFPFRKLTLKVDKDIIKLPEFEKLLSALGQTNINQLNLVFYYKEIESSQAVISKTLLGLADKISYFVQIRKDYCGNDSSRS